MTKLGEYLILKSVNKSEVARKTGLSKPRLSELTLNHAAKLRADELYLIALAIDVNPSELLEALYGELRNSKKNKRL
jgi:DNA-binding Xre family transcriptional regulator